MGEQTHGGIVYIIRGEEGRAKGVVVRDKSD